MNVLEILAFAAMLLGTLFVLLASLGVARLPDVYCRLSATSKAVPFGVGLLLAGAALALGDASFALQAVSIAAFMALTAPVVAHALGRAAHQAGVPPCAQTRRDELPVEPPSLARDLWPPT